MSTENNNFENAGHKVSDFFLALFNLKKKTKIKVQVEGLNVVNPDPSIPKEEHENAQKILDISGKQMPRTRKESPDTINPPEKPGF